MLWTFHIQNERVIDVVDLSNSLKPNPVKIKDVKREKYKTFGGEYVRSKSERDIANWLYEHDISYDYEVQVSWADFPFNPDFFLSDLNVYIEHWMETDDERYRRSKQDKIEQFRKHKVDLIQTQENEMRDIGALYRRLKAEISKRLGRRVQNKKIQRLESDVRTKAIFEEPIATIVRLLSDAIGKMKNEQISEGTIKKRLEIEKENLTNRVRLFFSIFFKVHEEYHRRKIRENYLDFDDLLIKVVELFEKHPEYRERYQKKYSHILVDEFQDINSVQLTFLRLLVNEDTQLFCVGDDWQGIYGWRGAKVKFILEFEEIFPDAQIIMFQKNFRNSPTIVNASNEFIKSCKYLRMKEMISNLPGAGGPPEKIMVHPAVIEELENGKKYDRGIDFVIKKVKELIDLGDSKEDILILYRYHDLFNKGGQFEHNFATSYRKALMEYNLYNKITHLTMHAAKGKEAKNVFIVGCWGKHNGYNGIPNMYEGDKVFQYITPRNITQIEDEERRLFYVSMTRAKERLFILTEEQNESKFLEDIPGKYIERGKTRIYDLKIPHNLVCQNCGWRLELNFRFCPSCSKIIGNAYKYTITREKKMKIKLEIQKWRSSKAAELNLPPDDIFDDKTLSHLIEILPLHEFELMEVNGFDSQKCDAHGYDLISIINVSLFEQEGNEDC